MNTIIKYGVVSLLGIISLVTTYFDPIVDRSYLFPNIGFILWSNGIDITTTIYINWILTGVGAILLLVGIVLIVLNYRRDLHAKREM